MQQPKLTLLTCTHNGSSTMPQVLEAIAYQKYISKGLYEILIVDNASTDNTFEIALNELQRLGLDGRVLREPKLGKINAFLKGVYEARGELISIIDDDNYIESEFIYHTLEVFNRYPEVGMVGSTNQIYTDQPVPAWFKWAKASYGCSQPWFPEIEKEDSDGVVVGHGGIVAGAGSTFCVKPLLKCLEKGYEFFNDTQRGSKMRVTGEDTELCWLLHCLGYQFAYSPYIKVRHAIKADRLNLEHCKILCKTIGAGFVGIDPFIFTYKYRGDRWHIQWTWQWQLAAKLKCYMKFIFFPRNLGSSHDECQFNNWRDRVECMGAVQRIFLERSNYTNHIRQVASGEWTELRVR